MTRRRISDAPRRPVNYGTVPAMLGGDVMVQAWPDGTFGVGGSVLSRQALVKLYLHIGEALTDTEGGRDDGH